MIASGTCHLWSLPVLIVLMEPGIALPKNTDSFIWLFFLFFWVLFRDGMCIHLRRSLASKQFCSQWFHTLPQHCTWEVVNREAALLIWCFIFLLGMSIFWHHVRFLTLYQYPRKENVDPGRWALAPHPNHPLSCHSPWLPKIYRSRDLPTSMLSPVSQVPFNFSWLL